jgi:hypothetical protein
LNYSTLYVTLRDYKKCEGNKNTQLSKIHQRHLDRSCI